MPTSSPEYRLSPAARNDLEGIWLYTLEKWSLDQANQYIDELVEAFQIVAESPGRFMSCDDIRPGYRFFRRGRHVGYFKETDYGVSIIRVLHDRMLPSRYL